MAPSVYNDRLLRRFLQPRHRRRGSFLPIGAPKRERQIPSHTVAVGGWTDILRYIQERPRGGTESNEHGTRCKSEKRDSHLATHINVIFRNTIYSLYSSFVTFLSDVALQQRKFVFRFTFKLKY